LSTLVISTIEDFTTQDSATTASSISLNDGTLTDSTSTLANSLILQTPSYPPKEPTTRPVTTTRPQTRPITDTNDVKRSVPPRPNPNGNRRERRMIVPKNQRRLLQYELMPTGKVYYVDRPFYKENKTLKGNNDDNSSAILSTIISRSSSLDTLSDKHRRHQQHNRKYYHDLSFIKKEQKLSIGGRLASNNNLITAPTKISSFKPINSTRKNRFSSFEPTRESLDRVFDVLIAADKRREENDFWREKFDHRTPSLRAPIANIGSRTQDTTISNTIPFLQSKQTQLTPNSDLNKVNNRSQSYTTKRTSFYEGNNRQNGCLLEDCLRRRTPILQQKQQPERNYSPNTIYSTNYPKQELYPTGKPPLPTTTTTHQPIRILPLSNGRLVRAPQARQTSDELSSTSEVWATRSPVENQSRHPKKSSNHARFSSVITRSRPNEQKPVNNKRASSVEQQKPNRTQNKNLSTSKSKFFDLFKFTR
jgi:hypothetical protein